MSTIVLHCIAELSRETGLDRQRLRGLIDGLGLTVYRGHAKSVAIDDDARKILMTHLRQRGVIDGHD